MNGDSTDVYANSGDAGEFTMGARLRTAVRNNAIFYAVSTVIGVVVIAWLFANGQVQGTLGGKISPCMCVHVCVFCV